MPGLRGIRDVPGVLRNGEDGMSTQNATATKASSRRATTGVRRLVRRLERERRTWARSDGPVIPTEQAWRAGVAEGLRLAQVAIRKGV